MAYRFKAKEHPGCGLRRIYCEELDSAHEQSRGGANGPTARHVHEVRKHLKKSRAILRLLRDEIGRKKFKPENLRLRDAGRKLSALRDAEVRLRTIDRLRELYFEKRNEFPNVRRRLSKEKRECAEEAEGALKKVGEELRRARKHGKAFKVAELDADAFCDAARRTYQRGRAALCAARQERDQEALHELRKRLKDLWYQLRIACPLRPKILNEQVRQAKQLTELLGEYLDLAVLGNAIAEENWKEDTAAEREAILAIIATRQAELHEAALDLSETFLCERPAAFSKRLRGYFPET